MPDPSDVLTRRAPPPSSTIRYADGPDHVADLWLPAVSGLSTEPTLVVVIHGGFWRSHYGREISGPMCADLAGRGYVAVAIEYRRTGAHGPRAGGWPTTTDDVRSVLTQLPDLVATATGIRTGSTFLVGHSAGGHLALWAGSQVVVPGLTGVVSLAGVCDLARADELGLGAQGDRGAVAAFLGGSPAEQPAAYAAADPMRLPPPPVPVTLVHGTEDDIVPIEISGRYAAYATAAGAQVTLAELPGVEHFGPIDPLSSAWPTVLAALTNP